MRWDRPLPFWQERLNGHEGDAFEEGPGSGWLAIRRGGSSAVPGGPLVTERRLHTLGMRLKGSHPKRLIWGDAEAGIGLCMPAAVGAA